ncbi:CGNR zinc finger domain-containing protein [Streptomyces sp. LE64]|uniref:CGNR zinc finger domain-containing protein n=1 Tax=Streptomyces sp. LE64 TaxID=3448653 RepID=UPI0040428C28
MTETASAAARQVTPGAGTGPPDGIPRAGIRFDGQRPRRGAGFTLHGRDGAAFHFDPGALCLELVLTGGPGRLARFESLHHPEDLVRWAALSRLPDGLDLAVTPEDLPAARSLRNALYVLAADRAHGRPWDPAHLATVNAAAGNAPLGVRFTPAGERAWVPGATVSQLLSTVARDAVDLFTGPHAHRVRECAPEDCALLFVDTSRPGRRRWCSMERCGNRHKVRAHRARAAAPETAG